MTFQVASGLAMLLDICYNCLVTYLLINIFMNAKNTKTKVKIWIAVVVLLIVVAIVLQVTTGIFSELLKVSTLDSARNNIRIQQTQVLKGNSSLGGGGVQLGGGGVQKPTLKSGLGSLGGGGVQ